MHTAFHNWKRFQDAGLKDLCIESRIVAEGSVSALIEGRGITEIFESINLQMRH